MNELVNELFQAKLASIKFKKPIHSDVENKLIALLSKRINDNFSTYFHDIKDTQVTIHPLINKHHSANWFVHFQLKNQSPNILQEISAKVCLPFDHNFIEQREKEYKALQDFYGNSSLANLKTSVPRPIDQFVEINTILMEKMDADSLTNLLKGKVNFNATGEFSTLHSLITHSGKILNTLHHHKMSNHTQSIKEEFTHHIFDHLKYQLHELQTHKELSLYLKDEIINSINSVLEHTKNSQFQTYTSHGDFHTGNILYKNNKFYLIDFCPTKRRTLFEDLSLFLTCFLNLYPDPLDYVRYKKTIKTYQNNFLEGYFGDLNQIQPEHQIIIELYKIKALIYMWHNRYFYYTLAYFRIKGLFRYIALRWIYKNEIKKSLQLLKNHLFMDTPNIK